MAYFPNGTSGDVYMAKWCERCTNWREHPDIPGNWGCIVIDLHLIGDYDQCKQDESGKLWKTVLEHFIPTGKDGFPGECRMFLEKANADIPGQMKFEEMPR